MTEALVLTFIAKDRPGLIDRLSSAVAGAGGNWLESRMVRLAEQFAGIARVEVPKGKIEALRRVLDALKAEGFHITLEDAAGPPAAGPPASAGGPDSAAHAGGPDSAAHAGGGRIMALDLVGPDHPGIVREIAHCLAERGISIEEMDTDVRPAPMSGDALFYARARVRVPASADERELSQALRALGNTLMVDIALVPAGD